MFFSQVSSKLTKLYVNVFLPTNLFFNKWLREMLIRLPTAKSLRLFLAKKYSGRRSYYFFLSYRHYIIITRHILLHYNYYCSVFPLQFLINVDALLSKDVFFSSLDKLVRVGSTVTGYFVHDDGPYILRFLICCCII